MLVLGHIAHGGFFFQEHIAAVRGDFSRQNAEQSGLSGTVNAYDCGFFSFFYMKCDIFQYGVDTIGFFYVIDCKYHVFFLRNP